MFMILDFFKELAGSNYEASGVVLSKSKPRISKSAKDAPTLFNNLTTTAK